eukprot:8773017-Ditylum_brightwellii.AAC.1
MDNNMIVKEQRVVPTLNFGNLHSQLGVQMKTPPQQRATTTVACYAPPNSLAKAKKETSVQQHEVVESETDSSSTSFRSWLLQRSCSCFKRS